MLPHALPKEYAISKPNDDKYINFLLFVLTNLIMNLYMLDYCQ